MSRQEYSNASKFKNYVGKRGSGGTYGAMMAQRKNRITLFVIIAVAAVAITFTVLYANTPKRYYVKDMFVADATVMQRSDGDSGHDYGFQVSLNHPAKDVTFTDENDWVGVDQSMYTAHNVGDRIGVLVCEYDVYRDKFLGLFGQQGQTYQKTFWGVDTAFDSYEKAQAEYPYQTLSERLQLKSKRILSDKSPIFILNDQDREMTVQVSPEQYAQYNVGSSVPCKLEGYGDFLRVTEVD